MSTDSSESTPRPVTSYQEAEALHRGTTSAAQRFDELDHRHHMVRAEQTLKARGEYDPAKFGPEGKYQPLTVDERLELIATGEMLARYYRHQGQVDHAVKAGATWEQIAAAKGSDEARARQEYRSWAEGQHSLWQHYEGKFGMPDAEHAEAMGRAAEPDKEAGQ